MLLPREMRCLLILLVQTIFWSCRCEPPLILSVRILASFFFPSDINTGEVVYRYHPTLSCLILFYWALSIYAVLLAILQFFYVRYV